MKDKLDFSDLALYWGCECQVIVDGEVFESGWVINTFLFEGAHNFGTVLPILRPLSDLTECEIQICYSLYFPNLSPWPVTSSICREAWWDSCISPNYSMCRASTGNPSVWRYLLSIGIDLFGWIDAGLAIDKTKMEKS